MFPAQIDHAFDPLDARAGRQGRSARSEPLQAPLIACMSFNRQIDEQERGRLR